MIIILLNIFKTLIMKNLKLGLFSLLAVLAISVFLTSCEQDVTDNVPSIEEQIDNSKMPEGHLATELDLRDEDNPLKGAVISVSTNNDEIFTQLTMANFKVKVINSSELDNSEGDNEEDVDKVDENFDESLLNTDEHFFSMKIMAENINEDEFIRYTFGDELLTVLKKYKAQTHIQISPEENNSVDNRNSVWTNYFKAYGDGGQINTKLRIWYDYHCNYNYYKWDTQYGFLWSYEFYSCKWPWNSSTRKRYIYFTVIQDVLREYEEHNTSTCSTC